MQCFCSPPLPVLQRTVSKSGNNFGKAFFSCPNTQCNFFCWVDETMNSKLHSRYMRNQSTASVSTSMNGSSSSSSNSSRLTLMKLMIGEFESGPPFQVWFDVQCPMEVKIRTFFQTISPEKKKLNQKTKMWSFNFDIYEHFVSTLLSSDYRSVVQVMEIPRFLINGIKRFLSCETMVPQEISLLGGMMDTILPFQLEAVEFVVRRGGRALIADEMVSENLLYIYSLFPHPLSRVVGKQLKLLLFFNSIANISRS
jgi:hypothetical protein